MKTLGSLLLALLLVAFTGKALAADPPPLEKADAKKIMEAMEWREVTVIAIRQGVDAKGDAAPIFATIVGLGKIGGEYKAIAESVYYDRDLQWYAIELQPKMARIWTKDGYREMKPWNTW